MEPGREAAHPVPALRSLNQAGQNAKDGAPAGFLRNPRIGETIMRQIRGLMALASILCLLACGRGDGPGTSGTLATREVSGLTSTMRSHDRVELAVKADRSLAAMVKLAAWELDKKGHKAEADQLRKEWSPFAGYLPKIAKIAEAGGDAAREVPELYAPLSVKLAQWYNLISAALGPELTSALHLDDLQVLNFGTVVVLRLDKMADNVVDSDGYEIYWDPWCGVLAYWGTWIGCEIGTMSTGWFVICTPLAMLAENVTVNFVAPRFSDRGKLGSRRPRSASTGSATAPLSASTSKASSSGRSRRRPQRSKPSWICS